MRAMLWMGAALGASLVGLGLCLGSSAIAQSAPLAQPAPMTPAIEAPRDVAYPGQITLDVDVTDLARSIFNVHETIPIQGGAITLLYPRWIPGNHAPSGAIEKIAGIIMTADGQPVSWVRDPADVYAFHVTTPPGAHSLDVRFQYLTPTASDQGRITATPDIVDLQWISTAFYPAGYFARRIMVAPSVTLPQGWHFGTALDVDSTAGNVTHFKPIDFENLADSPMFAGRYFRQIDLNPGGAVAVRWDIVADRPELLGASEAQIAVHRRMVQQEFKLYGSHHFDHYDLLLALSNQLGGIGLEHQRSSENSTGPEYFTQWDDYIQDRDLLAHESTHSWNGKYRRPADLWVPNFNVPMRDSLLWVYEGQTQYWGFVLSGRSGLLTHDQALQALAGTAATYDNQLGHTWRALEDTTNDPIIARRQPQAWRNWQRSEDYYSEGQLIWLDADTLIRERTHNAKSLDNFAHDFFGVDDGSWVVHPYTFDDVVAALNHVMAYDWARFLHQRLDQPVQHAPLDGITRGGYRLVYTETRNEYQKSNEKRREMAAFNYSIGIVVANGGRVGTVMWDSPAFQQGIVVGSTLQAVNGQAYTADVLRRAITAAKTDAHPIELLIRNGDRFRTVELDYHGGLRYPQLARIPGAHDLLTQIYAPRR